MTAQDNKSQNNGRALGLNQRALDFCFDACEAHLSRLTVIVYSFPIKNKEIEKKSHTPQIYITLIACVS